MCDVAIIIPTLNRASTLKEAIASALGCDPSPAEVVVVDCGSTDDTRSIVRSFGDGVSFIQGVFPNAGAARNAGVAATRAPLIGFLDSDDAALPGKTGGLAGIFEQSRGSVLVHGTTEVVDRHGQPLPHMTAAQRRQRDNAASAGTDYVSLARSCSMYTSATMIRRDPFKEVGGYDESLDAYEDWDLYLRLSRMGTLDYADVPACRYRIWDGNVAWDQTARGMVSVSRKHLAMLQGMPKDQRERAEFGFRVRMAGSLYTLVELPEARREAWTALSLDPRSALAITEVRRALLRSFLPTSMLYRRRPKRTRA